ncbi:MAG: hypothetical protein FWC66_05260 [Oscillospiraceae bacterium]|nr:hypothetical protein [Oscillospiraceae bacterium]
MKRNQSKRYRHRKIVVAIATAMIIIATLTGTLASGTNQTPPDGNFGGRLRSDASGTDQRIYAENFDAGEVFLRIKLLEYMEIGDEPLILGSDINDVMTWTPFVHGAPSGTNSARFRDYVSLGFGGDMDYFMPTFNRNRLSDATDFTGPTSFAFAHDSVQVDVDMGTADHRVFDPQFASSASGEFTSWISGQTAIGTLHTSSGTTANYIHTAKTPVRSERGGVMTRSEWETLSAEDRVGNFWVATPDGWAYWANALAENDATSLFLRTVQMNMCALVAHRSDENILWYYSIYAIGQFSDASNLGDFIDINGLSRSYGGGAVLYTAYRQSGGGNGNEPSIKELIMQTDVGDTFMAGGRLWRVLQKNVFAGQYEVLVISESAIMPVVWNNSLTTSGGYAWSHLRWLTDEFYQNQMQWAHPYATLPDMAYWNWEIFHEGMTPTTGVFAMEQYNDVAFNMTRAHMEFLRFQEPAALQDLNVAYNELDIRVNWWTSTIEEYGRVTAISPYGLLSAGVDYPDIYLRPLVWVNLSEN